jgi:hypothetical protein
MHVFMVNVRSTLLNWTSRTSHMSTKILGITMGCTQMQWHSIHNKTECFFIFWWSWASSWCVEVGYVAIDGYCNGTMLGRPWIDYKCTVINLGAWGLGERGRAGRGAGGWLAGRMREGAWAERHGCEGEKVRESERERRRKKTSGYMF